MWKVRSEGECDRFNDCLSVICRDEQASFVSNNRGMDNKAEENDGQKDFSSM